MAAFRLTSPAFDHDAALPLSATADRGDVSPPLEWSEPPEGTRELALVCDDPDVGSGVFTHWIVYGLAPDATGLPEGLPRDAIIDEPVPAVQGLNDYDDSGYSGPQAEDDDAGPHRYFFRLFALDAELDLAPGITRTELRRAAKDHVLATAELVGIA